MHPRVFHGAVTSGGPDVPGSAFDASCFDFTSYLGGRLGVGRVLAEELLGRWLRTYEPVSASDATAPQALALTGTDA